MNEVLMSKRGDIMKGNQKPERFVLVGILFVFFVSVGIIQGRKVRQYQKPEISLIINPNIKQEVSAQYVLNHINPLLLSRSVNTLAKVLKQFRSEVVREVLERIVVGANPLDRDEKIILILLLAESFSRDKHAQNSFFNLLNTYHFLHAGTPILLLAAESEMPQIIPNLIKWMSKKKKNTWIMDALNFAIEHNKIVSLKTLYQYGVPVTKKETAQLLIDVIRYNKDVQFIPFLLNQGIPVSYINKKNNRTLLMEAVVQNNKPMVRILLERGADPNKIIKNSVGSAMQLAFERGFVDLENLMRSYSKK